ncbi:MAG TPA: hypothetical protein VIT91_15535 [Chthoniobacterales bacterium]
MSELASRLLAEGLARHSHTRSAPEHLAWKSKAMEARIDLSDKEALYRVLDQP